MSKADLKAGEDLALQLVPILKELEGRVDDPVHLYAGLMMALTGICVGAIGKDSAYVLSEAAKSVGAEACNLSRQ